MARSAVKQAPSIHDIKEAVEAIMPHGFVSNNFLWNFMEAYGAPHSQISQLHATSGATLGSTGAIWRTHLHYIESLPGDIDATLQAMMDLPRTKRNQVRFVMTCDGHDIAARDLKTGELLACRFAELATHYSFFLPLAGREVYIPPEENPVDVKAAKALSQIYDAILAAPENAEWRKAERQHDLNHFMAQLIFCLFAEDTGIFEDNLFSRTLYDHCGSQPWTTADILKPVFDAMSVDGDERLPFPGFATAFPFVNGGLFRGDNPVPHISANAYRRIYGAAQQDWGAINPDIFGSMIQAVADADQRSELGLHYTSVPNILKALNPLFLDELNAARMAGWNDRTALMALLERLTKIRIFDPAAGSGNFLVIAYKELRKLEMQIVERLHDKFHMPAPLWPHVKLQNFFGIEIQDFSCETARLGLWLAEYQMNRAHGEVFGKHAPPLPLRDACTIRHGNALRIDWHDVCPPSDDPAVETYIVGNPPYKGQSEQTDEMKSDLEIVFNGRSNYWKSLDYVAGWFLKAADYVRSNKASFALVATNSVNQGQQVPILWPLVLEDGIEILFAHRSFKWRNNAAKNAGVTCVIVGCGTVGGRSNTSKLIYEGDVQTTVPDINSYLIAGEHIELKKRPSPLSSIPPMEIGAKPADGSNLILTNRCYESLISTSPDAEKFTRKYVGSRDFIDGIERYCLWVEDSDLETAIAIPEIQARFENVREFRLKSDKKPTERQAATPHKFAEARASTGQCSIIIPSVSSERREYLPVGWLDGRQIISNAAFAIYDAEMWLIALIGSRLHQLWISTVCGRLRTDIRYSNTLGWNTFPVPDLSKDNKTALTKTAENILLARDAHFPATIAQLYDPEKMPDDLRAAHRANDELLEGLYTKRPFKTDNERLQHMFDRYAAMTRKGTGK